MKNNSPEFKALCLLVLRVIHAHEKTLKVTEPIDGIDIDQILFNLRFQKIIVYHNEQKRWKRSIKKALLWLCNRAYIVPKIYDDNKFILSLCGKQMMDGTSLTKL